MSKIPGLTEATNGNENGRLYLWGGAIAAIISVLIVPVVGLLAVYCGYKLYNEESRPIPAILIAGFGGVSLLNWIIYLATL